MIGFFVMCAVLVAVGCLILKLVNSRLEKKALENIHAPTIEIGNLLIEGDARFIVRSPETADEMRRGYDHVIVEYGGKKSTFYRVLMSDDIRVFGDFDWMNDYEIEYIHRIAKGINNREIDAAASEAEARLTAMKETARQMMIDSLKK